MAVSKALQANKCLCTHSWSVSREFAVAGFAGSKNSAHCCHIPEIKQPQGSAVTRWHREVQLRHWCPPAAPSRCSHPSVNAGTINTMCCFTSCFFSSSHEAQQNVHPAPGFVWLCDHCRSWKQSVFPFGSRNLFPAPVLRCVGAWWAVVPCHHLSFFSSNWILVHFLSLPPIFIKISLCSQCFLLPVHRALPSDVVQLLILNGGKREKACAARLVAFKIRMSVQKHLIYCRHHPPWEMLRLPLCALGFFITSGSWGWIEGARSAVTTALKHSSCIAESRALCREVLQKVFGWFERPKAEAFSWDMVTVLCVSHVLGIPCSYTSVCLKYLFNILADQIIFLL